MNPDTGNIIKSYIDQEIKKSQMDKPNTNQVKFIGLETTEKHLITCNSNGTITMTEWNKDQLSVLTTLPVKEQQLEIMRIHPIHRHIMAVGGKDFDLKVFDLNKLANKEEDKKESNNKVPNSNPSSHPHQKQKKGITGLLYEAKNVKNDFLDLQQPIWIHDLQFMNEDGTQIALSTHYYQIRLYDFKKARRPILNVEIGKKPLTSLSIGQDFDHVVFTDTMNDVGFFNIKTRKLAGQLKAKSTQIVPIPNLKSEEKEGEKKDQWIVSVALDRFLRVHELKTRLKAMEHKIYLKQRLTAILVDTDYVIDTIQKQEEEEAEELWNNLDTITEKKDDKKKKARLA
ncbi:hypothetical protein BJ944DRAFT_165440 [Cunninghamella echinulata]|nr:hypothetical protein BJ944DRAFT_165440 [Cunninghamella echinulata]